MVPAPSGAGRAGDQPLIDMAVARELIDFNASSIGKERAEEQLAGAVAMHNILERHNVAYLADEVGMGKTYVALGAMALFRHFEPEFRVLVIAPRENIQRKWMKELGNFAKNNVRFPDLRVKSLRGGPARPIVMCHDLPDFVHEVSVDSRRDFFLRMTSFSFGLGTDTEEWKKKRDSLRRELPWLEDEVFDLRTKEAFKDNFARAICCALPKFDLVIVDEGRNLKHGFRIGVAARNRVMDRAFGRSPDQIDGRLFPGYGKRAERVLFLSATPIEGSFEQLWNQLDVFGLGGPFSDLKRRDATDEEKKQTAKRFLVRRVTTVTVNGRELTKNQYRREWRQGGVLQHDQPISVTDPKQRLIVALVQKKVAELLGSGKSMHEGLVASGVEDKRIDVAIAVARGRRPVETISERLRTAFPVPPDAIAGGVTSVAVTKALAERALERLTALQRLSGEELGIEWAHSDIEGQLFGTMRLAGGRIQPFTLLLDSLGGRLLIRCISPIGVVDLVASLEAIQDSVRTKSVRLGAIRDLEDGSYKLTVQEDVLRGDCAHDAARVNVLLKRVAEQADRLEQIRLPDADRALHVFADDLRQEGLGHRD